MLPLCRKQTFLSNFGFVQPKEKKIMTFVVSIKLFVLKKKTNNNKQTIKQSK
jgi:hypothetical protein